MKDLGKLSDDEIVEYLTGKRVTVVNSISQSEEEVAIRSDARVAPQLEGGVLKFLSPSGWRFISIANIKSVSRKKVA